MGNFARLLALSQLVLIPLIVLVGDFAIRGADLLGSSFLKLKHPTAEVESSHFWKALAISLAASVAYYAYRVWRDPRRDLEWIHPVAVVAGTGALSYLFYFLYYYTLSLLVGFILLAAVLAVVLWYWWSAKASRQRANSEAARTQSSIS